VNDKCTNCGLCISCCPGVNCLRNYDSHISKSVYGYSCNDETRYNSASGGVLTELLCFLIENSIVSYVTVVTNYEEDVPKVILTNDTKVIRENKASKYCPIDFGDLVTQIKRIEGTVALVGLPCMINSMREFSKTNRIFGNKIKYFFSLFCNHVPSFHALEYLKQNSHIDSFDAVYYRGGGWPGFIQFKKSNKIIQKIPYRFAMRKGVGRFFKNRRCELCDDPFGDSADASFGDAYFCDEETLGQTLVLIRNKEISDIMDEMNGNHIKICSLDSLDSVKKFYKKLIWRHSNTREFAYFLNKMGKDVMNLRSIVPISPNFMSKLRYKRRFIISNIGKYKLFWKILYHYAN
jgi:coenzyme F420 hydrogenase subunit beta